MRITSPPRQLFAKFLDRGTHACPPLYLDASKVTEDQGRPQGIVLGDPRDTQPALEHPKNDKKQYVTGDSQEITHPSTSPAQTGLSCEF